jgi:hypothetical protein
MRSYSPRRNSRPAAAEGAAVGTPAGHAPVTSGADRDRLVGLISIARDQARCRRGLAAYRLGGRAVSNRPAGPRNGSGSRHILWSATVPFSTHALHGRLPNLHSDRLVPGDREQFHSCRSVPRSSSVDEVRLVTLCSRRPIDMQVWRRSRLTRPDRIRPIMLR